MWTRLRLAGAIALSVLPDPDQHRMNGARLHLTVANNGPGPAMLPAPLRPLIHVKLAGLHQATALGTGVTLPGALYALPHPLHSPRNVRLSHAHTRVLPADVVQRPPEQTSRASRQPHGVYFTRGARGVARLSAALGGARARPSPHISPPSARCLTECSPFSSAPSPIRQSSPRANSIYSRSSSTPHDLH